MVQEREGEGFNRHFFVGILSMDIRDGIISDYGGERIQILDC